jgi:hypothetical protein
VAPIIKSSTLFILSAIVKLVNLLIRYLIWVVFKKSINYFVFFFRFMASQQQQPQHSRSTPSSPARMFQNTNGGRGGSNDLFAQVQSMYSSETITRLARHLFTHQEGIKIAAFLVKRLLNELK